jgi:hypothetical protein
MKLHVLIVLKVQLIDQYGLIDVDVEVDLNALVKHAVEFAYVYHIDEFQGKRTFFFDTKLKGKMVDY